MTIWNNKIEIYSVVTIKKITMDETTSLIIVTDENDTCAICLEKLDENIINLPCNGQVNHTFHKACILENIEHNRNVTNITTCPTCRMSYNYSTNHNYTVSSNMVWYVLKYNLMVYYLHLIVMPINITAFTIALLRLENSVVKYIAGVIFSLQVLFKLMNLLKTTFVIRWIKAKDYNQLRYGYYIPPQSLNTTSYLILNLFMPVLYILCIFFPLEVHNIPISLVVCSWIDNLIYIGLFSVFFKEKKTLNNWLDKIFASWHNIIKADLDNVKFYLNIVQDHQCGHICDDNCVNECLHDCDCESWKKIEL